MDEFESIYGSEKTEEEGVLEVKKINHFTNRTLFYLIIVFIPYYTK